MSETSDRPTTRWPFRVTIYDRHAKQHCVTVWLDVPVTDGAVGWDALEADEKWAAEDVRDNLEVTLDTEALLAGEPNQ